MNITRLKQVEQIIVTLKQTRFEIEQLKEQEEEYRDNIPEVLQHTDRYYFSDRACDGLGNELENIESVADSLNETIDF